MLLSLNKSHVEREKGNSDFQLLHDKYMLVDFIRSFQFI